MYDIAHRLELYVLYVLKKLGGATPLRIQKTLFIFNRAIGGDIEFFPYDYGPFSEDIAYAIEDLLVEGYIREVYIDNKRFYIITPEGEKYVNQNIDKLYKKEILDALLSKTKELTDEELLFYVYTIFGYTEYSKVYNKLMKNKEKLVKSLYKKGLLSTQKAAEILGIPPEKFIIKD